jgi:hypothetical protein
MPLGYMKLFRAQFSLEHFKKQCGHSERGFFGFGEALAKEQARSGD